jgi:hypothetical protein
MPLTGEDTMMTMTTKATGTGANMATGSTRAMAATDTRTKGGAASEPLGLEVIR